MVNSQLSGTVGVFVVFADFCSVNTPTFTDFKLPLDRSREEMCTIVFHEFVDTGSGPPLI